MQAHQLVVLARQRTEDGNYETKAEKGYSFWVIPSTTTYKKLRNRDTGTEHGKIMVSLADAPEHSIPVELVEYTDEWRVI